MIKILLMGRNFPPLFKKENIMKIPKMLDGESGTRLLQGAIAGSIATMAIGFIWGGWTLDSTAEKMATQRVTSAVVAAYAPVCVERYNANATTEQRAAFSKESEWSRDSLIEKAGYATPPGSDLPNASVADACAKALTKILSEAAATK